MKKYFTLLFITPLLFISTNSYSQTDDAIYSMGLDLALPIGDLSNATNFGAGVTVKALWEVGGNDSYVGANVGIMNFFPKKDYNTSINKIPFYVDFRQYFGSFFVEPQMGLSIALYQQSEFDAVQPKFKNLIGFGWAVGAGYTLDENFDFSLRFEANHNKNGYYHDGMIGFLALRVAYNVPFDKF